MQCCTCSNWVHLKCSLLFFSRFRTLGSSHSWNCPPCFFGDPTPTRTVTSSSEFSCYTSTAQSGPHLLMQQSHTTFTFKPFILPLCIFSLCTLITASCSWMFLFTSFFLFPSLPPSGLFNGMLGITEPGPLNCYTLFRLIPFTLSVFKNLILINFPLSGSLDSLLSDLITATSDLVCFLLMSQTLTEALSFSSGRAYSSLSFLRPIFLHLTPTLIM